MRFSIIIPAFNAENSIERALNSIKNQTFEDFEALIIDDGSIDNTANLCKNFIEYDQRFKYHFQANAGVSAARNRGIDYAKGEYLVFLDSDDAYRSSYLSILNQAIETHGYLNNFWIGYETVEDTSTWIPKDESNPTMLDFKILDRNNTMALPALWNKAYKKNIIDSINLRMPENLSLGEDFIFNYKYLDASGKEIVMIDEKVYLYTKSNSASLDGKYRNNLIDIYETLEREMLFYFNKWNVSQEQFSRYHQYVFNNRIKLLYEAYRIECPLTKKEKLKHNRAILKMPKFRESLATASWHIHPLYKFAYKVGSWRLIQFLDKLVSIKGKMR